MESQRGKKLIFAPNRSKKEATKLQKIWKILIIDDEPEVHDVTKMVLTDFSFLDRKAEFLSAHSRIEGEEMLRKHKDICLVLLDVVMEEDDSGLQLVRFIRDELENHFIRIILRTGQPGQAPEKEVIINYDINDYKAKAELTSKKLFTSIVSSLRTYQDIITIAQSKKSLEKIKNDLEDHIKTLKISVENKRSKEEIKEDETKEKLKGDETKEKFTTLQPRLDPIKDKQDLKSIVTALQEAQETLKRKEKHLEIARKQLEVQEKLAYLGTLTSGIAHEIKNPLNFVNNYAALNYESLGELRETVKTNEIHFSPEDWNKISTGMVDLEHGCEKILEQGKRIDDIVNSMQQHSRESYESTQPVNVNHLLNDFLKIAKNGMSPQAASIGIRFETHFDNSIEMLEITIQSLGRSFLNILKNGIDAMLKKWENTGNGYVPTLSIQTKDLKEKIEIVIHDNGVGISQSTLPKIFHPFFTTNPPGKGTGLGLSICYDTIVQEHNGTIKAESSENEYATFTITLPKQQKEDSSFY